MFGEMMKKDMQLKGVNFDIEPQIYKMWIKKLYHNKFKFLRNEFRRWIITELEMDLGGKCKQYLSEGEVKYLKQTLIEDMLVSPKTTEDKSS